MKTLVIRLSSIGDVLLTTPVLRCLRSAAPDLTIDFCVYAEYAELLADNPNVSRVLAIERSMPLAEARRQLTEKYDYVIDLQNNFRSRALRRGAGGSVRVVNKRTLQRWLLVKTKINLLRKAPDVIGRYFETVASLSVVRVVDDGRGIDFAGTLEEAKHAQLFCGAAVQHDAHPIIGLCPGAKHFTKRWLPERYAELAVLFIKEKNARVILFGGKDDVQLCDTIRTRVLAVIPESKDSIINTAGTLTLKEVAGAMQSCLSIVTNDSALMHIAVSQKRPVVAIFGSTVKEFGFAPTSPNSTIIENQSLNCRPCTHIGRESCPKGHFRCMTEITAVEVKTAVEKTWILT